MHKAKDWDRGIGHWSTRLRGTRAGVSCVMYSLPTEGSCVEDNTELASLSRNFLTLFLGQAALTPLHIPGRITLSESLRCPIAKRIKLDVFREVRPAAMLSCHLQTPGRLARSPVRTGRDMHMARALHLRCLRQSPNLAAWICYCGSGSRFWLSYRKGPNRVYLAATATSATMLQTADRPATA